MQRIICTICLVLMIILSTAEATIIFDDGQTHTIDYRIVDHVYVHNNFWDEPTTIDFIAGGEITGQLHAYKDSLLNLSGGRVDLSLCTYDQSQFYMSSGPLRLLYMYNTSSGIISNGQIEDAWLFLEQNSVLVIQGDNFIIDSYPVHGTFSPYGGETLQGTLTGTLANGSLVNANFKIQDYASLILIPEPTTVLLLSLGFLFILKRK